MQTLCSLARLPLAFGALLVLAASTACTTSGTEPLQNAFPNDTAVVAGNFREAGSVSPSPFRAAVDVGLLLTNQSAQPETLISSPRGSCDGGMVVRAWRIVHGRQVVVWDSSVLPVVPCPAHALPLVLAPNAAVQLTREIASFELLGDSLPVGTYTFTVTADFQSPTLSAEVATPSIPVSTKFIVPAGTVLDGTWAGSADGILLTLPLHWTADSVTGTGTYQAYSPNTNRCGGGTLSGSGSVTLRAARIEDRLVGFMSFDNGWTPPFSAVQTGVDLLDGQFMSVDAGACQMPLGRQIPPPA